jgi:hypothetical protein
MLWFQKTRTENVEAVASMLALKRDRLAAVENLYRSAEQTFTECSLRLVRYRNDHRAGQPFALAGHVFLPLNPGRDIELQRLEHEKWQAEFRRTELLQERAELRKSLGL